MVDTIFINSVLKQSPEKEIIFRGFKSYNKRLIIMKIEKNWKCKTPIYEYGILPYEKDTFADTCFIWDDNESKTNEDVKQVLDYIYSIKQEYCYYLEIQCRQYPLDFKFRRSSLADELALKATAAKESILKLDRFAVKRSVIIFETEDFGKILVRLLSNSIDSLIVMLDNYVDLDFFESFIITQKNGCRYNYAEIFTYIELSSGIWVNCVDGSDGMSLRIFR
jgi:hypothetical protein